MTELFKPHEIEKRSMEIIESELNGRIWPEPMYSIVRRCIHTSADFDYADNLKVSAGADALGVRLMRSGCNIVTDTKMALAGINKSRLEGYGGRAHCFISDDDVVSDAKKRGCTRASVAMEKASGLERPLVFAIGNAPTALIAIHDMVKSGRIEPDLIIGTPVGFVNVVESKELIMSLGIPYIVATGRKGGSNIAASICNALLYYDGDV